MGFNINRNCRRFTFAEKVVKPDIDFFANDDGEVFDLKGNKIEPKNVYICYRDEGPDAWANSFKIEGPAWKWHKREGWTFWKDGISGWGFYGMDFITVSYVKNGYEVNHYMGDEY